MGSFLCSLQLMGPCTPIASAFWSSRPNKAQQAKQTSPDPSPPPLHLQTGTGFYLFQSLFRSELEAKQRREGRGPLPADVQEKSKELFHTCQRHTTPQPQWLPSRAQLSPAAHASSCPLGSGPFRAQMASRGGRRAVSKLALPTLRCKACPIICHSNQPKPERARKQWREHGSRPARAEPKSPDVPKTLVLARQEPDASHALLLQPSYSLHDSL